MKVLYRDGYRFQLESPFQIQTPIVGEPCPGSAFVGLDASGLLTFAAGYAWDGASGPIAQGPEIIRGSLAHDGIFQLLREHGLDQKWRPVADKLMRDLFREDGLNWLVCQAAYLAVRTFGARFADPSSRKPVLEAP